MSTTFHSPLEHAGAHARDNIAEAQKHDCRHWRSLTRDLTSTTRSRRLDRKDDQCTSKQYGKQAPDRRKNSCESRPRSNTILQVWFLRRPRRPLNRPGSSPGARSSLQLASHRLRYSSIGTAADRWGHRFSAPISATQPSSSSSSAWMARMAGPPHRI